MTNSPAPLPAPPPVQPFSWLPGIDDVPLHDTLLVADGRTGDELKRFMRR